MEGPPLPVRVLGPVVPLTLEEGVAIAVLLELHHSRNIRRLSRNGLEQKVVSS